MAGDPNDRDSDAYGREDYGEYDLTPEPGGEWYYADGQERRGPVTTDDLKAMLADRRVGPDQLVWRAGMADWQPAGQVPALQRRVAAEPPPAEGGDPRQLQYRSAPTPANAGYAVPDPPAGQATSALTCGIIAIVGALCCAPVGIILGIIAMVQGQAAKESPTNGGKATAGFVCGLIGLILSVLSCGVNAIAIAAG